MLTYKNKTPVCESLILLFYAIATTFLLKICASHIRNFLT